MFDKTDQMAVDTIRTLSIDAVQKANSGHPGLPMGAAPMAYALWQKHLNVNPSNTKWFNRDRFVLSAGHGSILLYSMLHLSGYDVSLDDLKQFRQWGSITPGHPEVHETPGVEATTGPLGQGFANAVGMAMAEAHLGAVYNKENFPVVDHYTYGICSDGDLMEGVASEAASLAGHLQLGKLIMLYDSNDISLDGDLNKAFTEDVAKRFESYGWQHILVEEWNDLGKLDEAIQQAQAEPNKPTIIEVKTVIGFGAPDEGTHKVHGAPLGIEGAQVAKKAYGWEGEDFFVPEEVAQRFKETIISRGENKENEWNELFAEYKQAYPELAKQLEEAIADKLPTNWKESLPTYTEEDKAAATRSTSGDVINAIAKVVPHFWGGAADLSSSNKTMMDGEKDFMPGQYEGRNIWYGVREFGMAAAMNGILLHGGTRSYVATFFVFTDYLRPAVRLAALSKIPAIYVMTHDSVAVGEDGPTHEPVEHLASFRAMPNLNIIRPADGNEVTAAWEVAMESKDTPTMLVLSRQNLPHLAGSTQQNADKLGKGAYVVSPQQGEKPEGVLIATGSEVALAIEAQKQLHTEGHDVSVVSMPSTFLFDGQSDEYKETILPKDVKKRVFVEMGSSFGLDRYTGSYGKVIGIDRFGASAPGEIVIEKFGFTPENVASVYKSL